HYFFHLKTTSTTESYTLSLHDALPILMPHELALDLDELHVGVVELTYDLRAPVVVELPELLGEVHATHARRPPDALVPAIPSMRDRKSTRLNSSHRTISYAVFCLKKKK